MKRIVAFIVGALAVSAAQAQWNSQPPPPVQEQPGPGMPGGAPQGPGQPMPGQPMPGQPMPGQPFPGQQAPGSQAPGQPGPGPQGPGAGQAAPNIPPPQWVREGMRLTYAVGAGQQQPPGMNPNAAPMPNLCTVDIVSVAQGQAGVDVRTYMGGGQNAPAKLMKIQGQFTPWGTAEYWMNPEMLNAMVQQPAQGMQAAAAQLEINGKQIQTIRIQANLQGGNAVYDYEPKSGVLLMLRGNAPGGAGAMTMTLLDMRQRQLPWIEGRPPSWLGKTRRYSFTGNMTMGGGQGGPGMPFTLSFDVLAVGANAINVKRTMQGAGGPPDVTPSMVMGPSQFGGIFLPPLALKGLKQGQPLDQDKILGTQMTVQNIGRTNYGRNVATILEENQGYAQYCDYELETGILLFATVVDKQTNQVAQIMLTGRQ